jgi:hypothetical protein
MPRRPPKPADRPANPRHKKKSKDMPPKPPRNVPILNYLPILTEMQNGDHRAAAIIAAGLLENNLALALMTRFRELTQATQEKLFDKGGAPLDTFSQKIQLGFALNLYGERVRDDLDRIRRVRNAFAHHLSVRNFDHAEVMADCDELNFPKWDAWSTTKPEVTNRRDRYLNTAAHLAERFALEARGDIRRPEDPRFTSYELWPFP